MSVALPHVINFAKEAGFVDISALIKPDNLASIHVLSNLGFSDVGEVIEDKKVLRKFIKKLN